LTSIAKHLTTEQVAAGPYPAPLEHYHTL